MWKIVNSTCSNGYKLIMTHVLVHMTWSFFRVTDCFWNGLFVLSSWLFSIFHLIFFLSSLTFTSFGYFTLWLFTHYNRFNILLFGSHVIIVSTFFYLGHSEVSGNDVTMNGDLVSLWRKSLLFHHILAYHVYFLMMQKWCIFFIFLY